MSRWTRRGRQEASGSPSAGDYNLWINWILLFVAGRTAEADSLWRQHADAVQRVAARLRQERPVAVSTLYRGFLSEPDRVPEHLALRGVPVSCTEDHDVACWFAHPDTYVSEVVVGQRPTVRGYVATIAPEPADVIFHHSWAWCFNLLGRTVPRLALLAAAHPQIGPEIARQVDWSLRTQREVVLASLDAYRPRIDPIEDAACPDPRRLDQRFVPPAFR